MSIVPEVNKTVATKLEHPGGVFIMGIRVFDRDEKHRCWNASNEFESSPPLENTVFYTEDLDSYPENSHQFFLLSTGQVYFKSYDCYPEYSMVGYPVEMGYAQYYLQEIYNENPINYSHALNNDSFGCLYDTLEDFWNDPLVNGSRILSCQLENKTWGFYHEELSDYTAFRSCLIPWLPLDKGMCFTEIEGLQHWLRFVHGFALTSTVCKISDVFYPLKAERGEEIDVLVKEGKKQRKVKWIHGKQGLTKYILHTLYK